MKTTFTKTLWAALIAVIGFGQSANSQIIFSEDFQAGIPGTWTIIDNDGLPVHANVSQFTSAWIGAEDFDNAGDTVAMSTSWYDPAGTSDDWLISPSIALTTNNTLAWQEEAQDAAYPDGYEVRISTTTPTIAGFMANPALLTVAAASGAVWLPQSVDLQAAGYSNQNVYLAWRNNSTDQFVLMIDDIVISAPVIGAPCTVAADSWGDLNTAGGAPCFDGVTCVTTDPNFTGIGIFGSEAYTLDNVQAGFDYVFDMCSGFGAGSWIPEITIVAPDGLTIDASNFASSTSGASHGSQCSLAWTASQTGTYTIYIHEMGTSFGDAPSQVDCSTSLAVDNGNPTVTCGQNPFTCLACAVAGTLTSPTTQNVCENDTAWLTLNGLQSSPADYSVGFSDAFGGTGGLPGGFTIVGLSSTDFPWGADTSVQGILSANGVPSITGTWVLTVYATDANDFNCDSTVTTTVNFLPASDPLCSMTSMPCDTAADYWTDLNTAGGAPCFDGVNCVPTDPNFTTIGIYGSEAYVLDNVEAGYDYVFDMCSGFGAGAWIPEITIIAPDGTTIDATNAASSSSGGTHGTQCALGWTASQSGTYTIFINEMGTSAGDAPSQANCLTSLAVDNGNPTVLCGQNPAPCNPPCEITLPFGCTAELEACGDSINDGCNLVGIPPSYQDIACNETICGTVEADGGLRDTDWYLFTVPATTDVTLTGSGEFPFVMIIADNSDCNAPIVLNSIAGAECETQSVTQNLTPGTYVAFFSADVFEGYPCTSDYTDYWMTLTMGLGTATANFSATETALSVAFTDLSTNADSWFWDFGDGSTSTDQNPTHVYASAGAYTACLIATMDCGGSDTTCMTVNPDIAIGISQYGFNNLSVYPNPSNGNFTIEISGVETVGQISIVDLNGRSVYEETVVIGSNFRKTIEPNLTSGSYVMRITTENDVLTSKLTIK